MSRAQDDVRVSRETRRTRRGVARKTRRETRVSLRRPIEMTREFITRATEPRAFYVSSSRDAMGRKFCAKTKLDELARDLAPLGIRDVEVRERESEGARRVVVVVRYGEEGIATVDATKLDKDDVRACVRALESERTKKQRLA